MEVKLTTLKKKVKDVFKRRMISLRPQVKDKLYTVVDLNIPQPNSCPECR